MQNSTSIFYEPFSSLSHLAAALYFLIASGPLLYKARGNPLRHTSVFVYCFSIVFLLSMSGVYHMLTEGGIGRIVLQRLDHAAIWTLIFGSFTPIHIILFRGFWRWAILGLLWTVGITGLVLEIIFFNSIPPGLSLTFYLLMGWVGVVSFWLCYRTHPLLPVRYLFYGGVCYSIGGLLDYLQWPLLTTYIGAHEIFHIFVILGIYFHWRFISLIASFAITKHLTIKVKRRPNQKHFAVACEENIRFPFQTDQEFQTALHTHLAKLYPAKWHPKTVRIKHIEEHFLDSSSPEQRPSTADDFHP